MESDGLAGTCTDDVGVARSVGALWLLGGGAWLIGVIVCSGCFVSHNYMSASSRFNIIK